MNCLLVQRERERTKNGKNTNLSSDCCIVFWLGVDLQTLSEPGQIVDCLYFAKQTPDCSIVAMYDAQQHFSVQNGHKSMLNNRIIHDSFLLFRPTFRPYSQNAFLFAFFYNHRFVCALFVYVRVAFVLLLLLPQKLDISKTKPLFSVIVCVS